MAVLKSTKVVTGKVRFSYAQVFEPASMDGVGTPKYSVAVLIPKTDTKTLKAVEDAIEAAKEQGKTSVFGGKVPAVLKTPLRDGDDERPDDDTYAGHMFVNAKSNTKPGIVDANLDKIMSQDEFYSGCYGRASLTFYPYVFSGSKGIACGLNNLQKLEDGERLAGGSSAEDDFGDDLL